MFIIVATNDGNGGIVSILVILLVVSGINGGSSDNNLLLLSPLVICYCRVALSILFATLSLLLIQYENENLNISIYVGISYMDLDNNFVHSFGNLESPKLIFSFFFLIMLIHIFSYLFVSLKRFVSYCSYLSVSLKLFVSYPHDRFSYFSLSPLALQSCLIEIRTTCFHIPDEPSTLVLIFLHFLLCSI